MQSHVTLSSFRGPYLPGEAGLVQPGLIHVDDSFALFDESNQSHGILLSLYQYFQLVGIRMELLGSHEAELHVSLQYDPDLFQSDIQTFIISNR